MVCMAGCQMLSNDPNVAQAAVEADPADVVQVQSPVIQDELILAGWNALRSMMEPVQLANGVVLSGEILAQFLVESQIPVVWGSDEIRGGSSCSKQYC